jgi:hypothetical protein
MKKLFASALLLVPLVAGCGGDSSKSPTAPSSTPTKIISLEGSLALGNVEINQAKEGSITIRNSGNTTLSYTGITASGGLTSICQATPTSGSVAAGGSQTVRFVCTPTALGAFSGTVSITADHTSGTNSTTLSGTAVAAQVPRINIVGVITNAATGAPIGGATVTAINVLTDTNARSTTDGNGYYSLANVGAGIVNLDWIASGYISQSARDTFTQDTRRDVRLTVAPPAAPALEYRVTGTGAASSAGLTYANCTNGTSQASDAQLPWSFTCSSIPTGQFLYISAQNNRNSGCVKTQIYKRGTLYKESESCGAFVIATASGTY